MKFESSRHRESAKDTLLMQMGSETSHVQGMKGDHTPPVHALVLGVDGLVRQCLRHEPAWPIELEHAIDLTEEAVMLLASQFGNVHELRLQGPGANLLASTLLACGYVQSVYTLDEVEALFNRLVAVSQGRPASEEKLPTDVRFVSALLILREFMHHLRIAEVVLPSHTFPDSV